MSRSRIRLLGGLAGISLAVAVAGSALATSPHRSSLTINGPRGEVECGEWFTFRATVRDPNGRGIAGVLVSWSFKKSPSDNDRIDPTQSTTNKYGAATTKIKFACVPGKRVIRATAGEISGKLTVRVETDDDEEDDEKHHETIRTRGAGEDRAWDGGSAVQGARSGPAGRINGTLIRATVELPRTSTAPDPWSSGTLPSAIIAWLALLAGSGLILRHLAAPRR